MLSLMYGFPFEDICMRVNIQALYTIVLQFDPALLSCGLEFMVPKQRVRYSSPRAFLLVTLSNNSAHSHRTVHEVIMLSQ